MAKQRDIVTYLPWLSIITLVLCAFAKGKSWNRLLRDCTRAVRARRLPIRWQLSRLQRLRRRSSCRPLRAVTCHSSSSRIAINRISATPWRHPTANCRNSTSRKCPISRHVHVSLSLFLSLSVFLSLFYRYRGMQGEGLVWLSWTMVCLLAAPWFLLSVSERVLDDHMMRCVSVTGKAIYFHSANLGQSHCHADESSVAPGRASAEIAAVMVDYCCSVLAGVSGHLLDRLQSILNAAARLVFSAGRSERITPLLRDLHWLWVPERIQFRLCVLAFRCLNASAPPYLAESVRRTADVEGRRHLRSYTSM